MVYNKNYEFNIRVGLLLSKIQILVVSEWPFGVKSQPVQKDVS